MNRTAVLACVVTLAVFRWQSATAGDPASVVTNAPQPSRVITRSASGRFVVEGPDSASNSQYTRWAEEIAARLERLLAVQFPLVRRDEPLEIVLVFGKMAGPAITARCWRENGLRRVLKINEFRLPDYELMQDSLCALLLDGYLEDRRRAMGLKPGEPSVPQWFSMGLSQNLSTETRNRNRKIVTRWLPPAERPELSAILQWQSLPEGWPRNRALCGMVVYWMGTLKEGTGSYARTIERMAGYEPVTVDWVAVQIAHAGSIASMEQDWQDWLTRQGRAIQEFGELSSVLLDQLKAELDLVVPAAKGGGPETAAPRRLTPSAVMAERDRSTLLRLAATEKIQKIRRLTLGKASELVEVGEAYCRFYEAVSRDAWTPVLRFRLARADSAFDRLATLTRAREAYLDEAEREWADDGERKNNPAADSVEPVLEKSRIQAYLDDAEKRFQQPGK